MWSYVIVLKNPYLQRILMLARLKQEQELPPPSAARLSSSSCSSSCSTSSSSLRPSRRALSPSSPSSTTLCSPSSPHRLRRPAVDLLGALRVRAESLKFLICLQPLKALQTRAESPSPFAWLLTSPEPLYFSTIYKCTRVSNCIILLLANEAHSAPVIDGQFF